MNKLLDDFTAHCGLSNGKDDDKWREPKTAFYLTQAVMQQSRSISLTKKSTACTVSTYGKKRAKFPVAVADF